jgi:rod shape-determining protein MreD
MKVLKYLVVFIILSVLQTTFCQFISIRGIAPDLIVLFIIYIGMKEGGLAGVYTGFAAGLCFDVYSPQILGAGALAKCLIGYLTGLLDERTLKIDDKYKIGIVCLASLLHDLILSASLYGIPAAFQTAFLPVMLPTALYTTLAGGIYILIDSRRINRDLV